MTRVGVYRPFTPVQVRILPAPPNKEMVLETKEKIIDKILKKVKKDILSLNFGRVIIYIQNGYPYRKEKIESEKIGKYEKDLPNL